MTVALPTPEGRRHNRISRIIKSRVGKTCINKPCDAFTNLLPKHKLCFYSLLGIPRSAVRFLSREHALPLSSQFLTNLLFPCLKYKKMPSLITSLSLTLQTKNHIVILLWRHIRLFFSPVNPVLYLFYYFIATQVRHRKERRVG